MGGDWGVAKHGTKEQRTRYQRHRLAWREPRSASSKKEHCLE